MFVHFNGFNLNEVLEVTEGFSPYGGADMDPITQDKGYNGEDFITVRRKPRTIEMPFVMQYNLRTKYDKLMIMLNVNEPKPLKFGAQPDRTYYAIPSGDLQVEEKDFMLKGTITWLITDGVGVSDVKYAYPFVAKGMNYMEVELENNGTDWASVDYELDFKDDSGYVGLVSEYGVIQVGNENESDYAAKKSQLIIADSAKDGSLLKNWTAGNATLTQPFPQSGTFKYEKFANRDWITASSFADPGNFVWGGAGLSRTFPADSYGEAGAKNFLVGGRLAFVNGAANQKGLLSINITDAEGKNGIGISIDKGVSGNQAKIRLYLMVNEQHIDINTAKNDYVSLNSGGGFLIQKLGSQLIFGFHSRQITYNVAQIKDVVYSKISIFSGKQKNFPACTLQRFEYIHVKKLYVNEQYDAPNLFMKGDKLVLDGNTTKSYRNDVIISDVQGSKWFLIPPGTKTTVKLYLSTFTSIVPEATAYVQEVFR